MIQSRTYAYQGVRNVSFPENFTYVLNEWPLMETLDYKITIKTFKRFVDDYHAHFQGRSQADKFLEIRV